MELVKKVDGKELFANRATNDSQGRKIDTTYATSSELATKQEKLTAGNGIDISRSGAQSLPMSSTSFPMDFLSNGDPLESYVIYGSMAQDGVPSPTSPVEVQGVGSPVVINTNSHTTVLNLSSPLYAIGDSVDMFTSVSDTEGVGTVVRYNARVNLSSLTWTASTGSGKYRFNAILENYVPNVSTGRATNVYLNRFKSGTTDEYGIGFGHSNGNLYIYVDSTVQTVAQLTAWLASHPSYAVYPMSVAALEEVTSVPRVQTDSGSNSLTIGGLSPSQMDIVYKQGSGDGLVISTDVDGFTSAQLSALKQALGVNETVLFEGEFTGSTLSLTEQVTNFEYIRIYFTDSEGYAGSQEILGTASNFSLTLMFHHTNNNFYIKSSGEFSISGSGSTFTRLTQGLQIRLNSTKLAIDGWTKNDTNVKLTKVVGIGRKTSDTSESGESWDPT